MLLKFLMLLAINNYKTLAELEDKFNECFPHLKIEFYSHPHHWKAANLMRQRLDPGKKVGEVGIKNNNGVLEIKSWYQVGRVEQDFYRRFGLNVKILRNENGTWVQTSATDSLMLKADPPPVRNTNSPLNPETDSPPDSEFY